MSGPSEAAPAGPDPADAHFVEDLLEDARLVAHYGRYAGSFRDDDFFSTLARVSVQPRPTLGSEAVVRLQRLLNDGVGLVPFTTLAALKAGWKPQAVTVRTRRRATLVTVFLILLSVGLMAVTAKLTYVYNKGQGLADELAELEEEGARATYYRLLRDVAQSSDLLAATGSPGAADVILARNAYFDAETELAALSERLWLVSTNASDFHSDEALFPVWGWRSLRCAQRRVARYLGGVTQSGASRSSDFWLDRVCGFDQAGQALATLPEAAPGPCASAPPVATESDAGAAGLTLAAYRAHIQQTAQRLWCEGSLKVPPDRFPAIAASLANVRTILVPYALWLLPAAYGSLGALMFHLRMMLDPLRPDPPIARVFHRTVVGGLAGIVLAWFLVPESAFGREFAATGLSLFVVAFLFGYSLDVFFALLDRGVAVTETRIRRFGTTPPKTTT